MRKLLVLPVLLGAVIMFGDSAKAESASVVKTIETSAAAAQYPQARRGRYNRAPRVRYQYRNVQVGRRVFRETYQIVRYGNGNVTRRLVSRTRIR